ncbi:MAG: hypothetical protein ACO1OG_04585 [Devosia sp.]
MRILLATALTLLAVTPALAQFPPPGVYTCVAETGENFGELNLFVAGDYSFRNIDGNSASGQLASAGTDINPLSGPLRDMNLTGSFATADDGATTIQFVTADGLEIICK